MGNKLLLFWNIICTCLLLNVVVKGILSAPGRLQRLAFDQPNIAIQKFPFILLPAFLVPLILFSHLAVFRQLLSRKQFVRDQAL